MSNLITSIRSLCQWIDKRADFFLQLYFAQPMVSELIIIAAFYDKCLSVNLRNMAHAMSDFSPPFSILSKMLSLPQKKEEIRTLFNSLSGLLLSIQVYMPW